MTTRNWYSMRALLSIAAACALLGGCSGPKSKKAKEKPKPSQLPYSGAPASTPDQSVNPGPSYNQMTPIDPFTQTTNDPNAYGQNNQGGGFDIGSILNIFTGLLGGSGDLGGLAGLFGGANTGNYGGTTTNPTNNGGTQTPGGW